YNVTFVGSGSYTVAKRDVTVILNDDYITYGDTKAKDTNVTKAALNGNSSILTKTINTTTKFKDADGNDVGVVSPATPPQGAATDYYKGGWYYSTDIDGNGKASAKFTDVDTTNGTDFSKILEYDITNYAAATDKIAGDTGNFINAKQYTISVKNISDHYNITFVNAQTGASGSTGTFIYEVRKATLGIDQSKAPDADSDGKKDFLGSTYNAADQTVELPAATVKKEGATTATTASDIAPTMQYWNVAFTETQYTDASFTAPTLAGTDWTSTKPTVKNAGKYKIYVKVSLKNHNDLMYDFVYEMNAYELDFDIVLKRKPDASSAEQTLTKGSTGYSEAYNGQAIKAEISYKWGTGGKPTTFDGDATKPTIVY
ncbi:MAG: hypothetical protein K2J30_01080, partial [Clostridia bacterium]|nr:hypothetical protein [Clostridia bacterium]